MVRKELPQDTEEGCVALLQQLKSQLDVETVDRQLRQGGEPGLTDDAMRRWLVARKWDVKAAHRDLTAHAAWRASYCPNGRIKEEEIQAELDQKKSFLQGCDKDGHPLCIVVAKKHIPQNDEMCKRYITYSLDAADMMGALSSEWDGKHVGIFDLTAMTMKNYDVGAFKAVFDLLQNHFPERLHRMYLYNAPSLFYGLWAIVRPFVDPVTREKVVFVYKREDFTKYFDPKVLPVELGGEGQWQTVDDALKGMLAKQEAS